MKVTRAQADDNRNRIIDVAAALFRERGFDGIGLSGLMKAAGLTHGGFYGNFKSKEDLIITACGRAFEKARDHWSMVAENSPADPLGGIIDFYLSARHRDAAGKGCPMAALSADASRQGDGVRRIFRDGIRQHLDLLTGLVPGRSQAARRQKALAMAAQMVGALVLARAAADPALSQEILAAAAADLKASQPTLQ